MHNDVAEILISADQIAGRIRELAGELTDQYADKPLTVIIISCGALMFGCDLVRQLPLPLELDVISAKSYQGTRSTREVTVGMRPKVDLRGRHVLLVDDIFDSGLTLTTLAAELRQAEPAELRTCVLLHKQVARTVTMVPDYSGFPIDNQFVVGYGLDYNECYRNLPYIGVLHPHLYTD